MYFVISELRIILSFYFKMKDFDYTSKKAKNLNKFVVVNW